jgi:hypothetical protein
MTDRQEGYGTLQVREVQSFFESRAQRGSQKNFGSISAQSAVIKPYTIRYTGCRV